MILIPILRSLVLAFIVFQKRQKMCYLTWVISPQLNIKCTLLIFLPYENTLVYVDIDQGIHKVKFKAGQNQKQKIYVAFLFT